MRYCKKMKIVQDVLSNNGDILKRYETTVSDSYNKDGYRIPSHRKGARFFTGKEFPKGMTDGDIGKMVKLSKSLIKGNVIGKRSASGYVACDIKDIGNILELKQKPAENFIGKMKKLHMVKKRDRRYIVNPAFFLLNGQRISKDLFKDFRDDLMGIVPAWAVVRIGKEEEDI